MQNSKKHLALAAICVSAAVPAALGGTLAVASATAATAEAGTWTAHHENVLGTSLAIAVHAPSKAAAARAERAILAEFQRQSSILSAWDKTSEFSRWQQTSHFPVRVSPELYTTLASFDAWQARTGGLLNAAVEDAATLWRNAATTGIAPSREQLTGSVQAMQQPHWKLDDSNQTATHLSASPLVLASFVKSRITSAAADAALREGADGVMLNVGGDIVTRGRMTQRVDVANPAADAENDRSLDTVLLTDHAIATSGDYRRFVSVNGERASHLIDPRTGEPARAARSVSVIARDAETAGALATALAVASPAETQALMKRFPSAHYLVVDRNGEQTASTGWNNFREARLQTAAYRVNYGDKPPVASAAWNQNFELLVKVDLPRIDDPRYRRPYVAVWIEDENKYPVRTVALWFQKPRWLPDLKTWYRDDRIRNLSEGTDLTATISSATRGPGSYTLKWDGKDNEGKLVKPGKYTVCVEGAREHGGYGIARHEMDFNGKPQTAELPSQPEIGAVALDYRKR